jgi:hypothetical protein
MLVLLLLIGASISLNLAESSKNSPGSALASSIAAAVVLSDLLKKLSMLWFCGFFFILLAFPAACLPKTGTEGVALFRRDLAEPFAGEMVEAKKGDLSADPLLAGGGVGALPVAGTAPCTWVVALRNMSAGEAQHLFPSQVPLAMDKSSSVENGKCMQQVFRHRSNGF